MLAAKGYLDKNRKWFWISTVLVVIVLALFLGLNFFSSWLARKLTRMVAAESKGVYTLRLHGLDASLLRGTLAVDSLSLVHDYGKWLKLSKGSADVPQVLIYLKAGKVDLNGLSYWRILKGESILLESLSITAPDMQITQVKQETASNSKPFHEIATGMLNGLHIDKIAVNQATFRYKHNRQWKNDLVKLDSVDLHVSQFKLDSQSFQNKDKAYYAWQIALKARGAKVFTTDAFYRISAGLIQADTKAGTIKLSGIKLQPLLKASEMAKKRGMAVTYVKGELPKLHITGIQFPIHSRTNQLLVQKVLLNQLNLGAYKDNKNFQNKGEKPLPHDIVQQIKTRFRVDTVLVRSMFVRYDEVGEKATESGHLYLTHLNGSITNLSNMPKYISAAKPAVIKAHGLFMGKAPVAATVRMPLLDKNGYHTLQAEVGQADPKILNPILEPTNLLSIKSGNLTKGTTQIELNQTRASGTMHILYNDFKIELLSESQGNKQSLGKKVLSKAVNAVAIKSENPSKGEKPRVGEVSAQRNKSRSVFTYWKDALASGFLSSIGLDIISKK